MQPTAYLMPGDSVSTAPLSSIEAMRPVTACPGASACAGSAAAATTDGLALITARPSMGRMPTTLTLVTCPGLKACDMAHAHAISMGPSCTSIGATDNAH